jgi:hypothetical protein
MDEEENLNQNNEKGTNSGFNRIRISVHLLRCVGFQNINY